MDLFESTIKEVIHTVLKAFRCANSYIMPVLRHSATSFLYSTLTSLLLITITGVYCIILCKHRYVRYINHAQ